MTKTEVFTALFVRPDADAGQEERQMALHAMIWDMEVAAIDRLQGLGWHPGEIVAELLTMAVTMSVDGLGLEEARKMLIGMVNQGCDQAAVSLESIAAVKH